MLHFCSVHFWLSKDLWIYGQSTQIAKYIVGGDTKTLIALLIPNIFVIFLMKFFSYAYKSFWTQSFAFSDLWPLLNPAITWIQKCSFLSSLKNKLLWIQKNFRPLIRKILIWTFWNYKSSWSKKSTPIQPRDVIGAPLLCTLCVSF